MASIADIKQAKAKAEAIKAQKEALGREKINAVRDASKPLTNEDVAGYYYDAVTRFGRGANVGIAKVLGLPVDIMSGLLSMAGVHIDKPFGGSESIIDLFNNTSVNIGGDKYEVGAKTEGAAGRIGQSVGATAAALPFLGMLGGAAVAESTGAPLVAQGARSTLGAAGNAIGQTVLNTPGRFALTELGIGASGGAGASVAREVFPGSQTAEGLGEIAGGFAGTGAVGLVSQGRRAIRTVTEPFTAKGQMNIAARRVQEGVYDKEAAVKALDEGAPVLGSGQRIEATTGQITNDPGLLGMERRRIVSDPLLKAEKEIIDAKTNRVIGDEIHKTIAPKGGDPYLAQRTVSESRDAEIARIDESVSRAVSAAKAKVDALGKDLSPEDASTVVRNEMELAYNEARVTEKAMWRKIHGNRKLDTTPLREARASIIRSLRKGQGDEAIPTEILQRIEKLDNFESMDDVISFRTAALEALRALGPKAGANRTMIKNLLKISDAADESLTTLTGSVLKRGPTIQKQIDAARAYTKQLNDRFTRGPIGRILKYDASGGKTVDDIETLDALFRQGRAGGVRADAFVNALGGRANAESALKEYVRSEFYNVASNADGSLNAAGMNRWLHSHGSFLDRFPSLKGELTDIEAVTRNIGERAAQAKLSVQEIRRMYDAKAGAFLGEDPQVAAYRIMTVKDSPGKMEFVLSKLRQDQSGEALEGFKQSLVDGLMARMRTTAKTATDDVQLTGQPLIKMLQDPSKRKALSMVLSKEEMGNLDKVSKAFDVVARSSRRAVTGGSDTAQNLLINAAARIIGGSLGARLGTAAGGSALVSANVGARIFRKMFEAIPKEEVELLLNKAVFDPQVMKTLLTRVTPENRIVIFQRLRSHLLQVGVSQDQIDAMGEKLQQERNKVRASMARSFPILQDMTGP